MDLRVEFEPGHAVGFEIFDVEEDLSRVFGGLKVRALAAELQREAQRVAWAPPVR